MTISGARVSWFCRGNFARPFSISEILAMSKIDDFKSKAETAARKLRLCRRADRFRLALLAEAETASGATISAEAEATAAYAAVDTVCGLEKQLRTAHKTAAVAAVFAAASALQEAEYAEATARNPDGFAVGNLLCDLRRVL